MSEKRGKKQQMFNTSRFGADAVKKTGQSVHEVQQVQEVPAQKVHEVQEVHEEKPYTPVVEFGATQGKKGHKAPRINMAFNPDNHAWIKTRSKQLGISATEFVNQILDRERLKETR